MIRSLVCVAWLGAVLAAQQPQTYIVDAANGPGTHFTDITAAAAAVPDGSILRVRNGAYAPVVVDGKGLTILCDPLVIAGNTTGVVNFLLIRNTQIGQSVTVRGLLQNGQGALAVIDAAGPVAIHGSSTVYGWFFGPACDIRRSRQVVVRGFWLEGAPGCQVEDSVVVFESCTILGNGMPPGKPNLGTAHPGLKMVRSDVQVAHSHVLGGNGWAWYWTIPGAPAVQLDVGNLRVVGRSTHALTGGNTPGSTPPRSILGTGFGTARVEPQIQMTGNPPAGAFITLTRPLMPSLVTSDAAPGGTLVARRYGAVGSVFVVALGMPGPVVRFPGLVDPLWFDPARFAVEAVGVGPVTGPFVIQRPVPNQPGLAGVKLVWQSADLHATGVIELSNPSPTVIR